MRYKHISDTSAIAWQLYPANVDEAAISADFDLEGHRIVSAFDCTGRPFSYPARVRRTATRVLVTQWKGLDV